jgi:DNA-binding beta-propeller fold protein YncE
MKMKLKTIARAAMGAALVTGASAWVAPLAAGANTISPAADSARGADHVVFVQTDNATGNQIVAYDRSDDGTLTLAATYQTGGLGGVLNGSVVDHLASQGSLAYDRAHGLLYAVNAGSNTVSVFAVNGDQLTLSQVVDSGGTFPVSVTVHSDMVYVLNAENGASVSGYRVAGGRLHRIEGSIRSLGLAIPTDATQFTHTPGQVAFSPDGSQLIVTTKAEGNGIDVFAVRPDGRLRPSPVVNAEPGAVPFGVTFDSAGHLLVANAGPNSLSTFILKADGTLTPVDSVANGQAATCWVAPAGGFFYTSNAGSPSLSGYQDSSGGELTLLGSTPTDPGTVDAAASADGNFLYVQTGGNGIVDEFQVDANGSLNQIGSITVAGATGGEGIVAI